MAAILIVDDKAKIREPIVTLIKHQGRRPLEAADGFEAVALVRSERPDLVISDILMPSVDGFEFVRPLRADALAQTQVIFFTTHYREREARNLAKICGVARVPIKPCECGDILRAIEQALAHEPPIKPELVEQEFDREHLRLMTSMLSDKVAKLRAANQRLAGLSEVNVQLASERNPRTLLKTVCRDARDLVGAKYALVCVRDKSDTQAPFFTTSGIDPAIAQTLPPPRVDQGLFALVLADKRPRRWFNGGAGPTELPAGFPPMHSALAAPIASVVAGIAEDISERLKLEGTPREREAALRRAQLVAKLRHVISAPDGSFESWSPDRRGERSHVAKYARVARVGAPGGPRDVSCDGDRGERPRNAYRHRIPAATRRRCVGPHAPGD